MLPLVPRLLLRRRPLSKGQGLLMQAPRLGCSSRWKAWKLAWSPIAGGSGSSRLMAAAAILLLLPILLLLLLLLL
jgi:hypothetical protein